jgi:hypothetical protein
MRANDVMGLLVSVQTDWKRVLWNPRNQRFGNVISWTHGGSFIFSDPFTYKELLLAVESHEYSFQLFDGSIIQIHYAFEDDCATLSSARLAYYGSPQSQTSGDYPDDTGMEVHPDPDFVITNWVRLDYQPGVQGGVLHSPCHIHIGGIPRSRLMVRRVPTPKQFIEFIMALCYPAQYARQRLDENGDYKNSNKIRSVNKPCIDLHGNVWCDLATHLSVPGV